MAGETICDELIRSLEDQRDAGVESVWLSPANLAWLESAAAEAQSSGPNPASTSALRKAVLAQAGATDHSVPAEQRREAAAPPQPVAPPRPVAAPAAAAPAPSPSAAPVAPAAVPPTPPAPPPAPPPPAPTVLAPLPDLQVPLADLQALVAECRRCGLCEGRTQTVFGSGNPNADLMFIGEGPGADEDRQGEPFVGAAGQLLTKIITAGMGLRREDVYITNVVKCRPPQDRNPEAEEAAACLPYLERQIELVAPKIIILLGAVPLRSLLGKRGITRLRGSWLSYNEVPVMPTFHPSYLLRVPSAKREVWADVQEVMAKLGLERPQG